MKINNLKLTIALLAAAAIGIGLARPNFASAAPLQQNQRRGGPMMRFDMISNPTMLLNQKSVQKDIGWTADQESKMKDARKALRASMQSGGDRKAAFSTYQAAVKAIITDAQSKRLKEIAIQVEGNQAALNPDIQSQLNLTDDQKNSLKKLQDGYQAAMMDIFSKVRNGDIDRSQVPALMDKNKKIMDEQIGKILTDDQKAELTKLGGAKFTGKIKMMGFGGPGGGKRRQGGGGPAGG